MKRERGYSKKVTAAITAAKDAVAADKKTPKSFVFRMGKVGASVKQLVVDLRRVMQPYTATNLKELPRNVLKDFISVAGPLGITHFLVLTQTEKRLTLRFARSPQGPTLSFDIHSFSTFHDVQSQQVCPHSGVGTEFLTPPVVVMSGFGARGGVEPEPHVKLMTTIFQTMFPAINVSTVKVGECRRILLFKRNAKTGMIQLRHYIIKLNPVGLSKGIKRVAQDKIPTNLGDLTDISEYVQKFAKATESDVEDDDEHRVELNQTYSGKLNKKVKRGAASSVRLFELGPRIEMSLRKIQSGLGEGGTTFQVKHKPEEQQQQ